MSTLSESETSETATGAAAGKSLAFVFWNVNGEDRRLLVSQLVAERDADVVILAESKTESEEMLAILSGGSDSFVQPPSDTPHLQLFARNSLDLSEIYGDASGRLSIRKLNFRSDEFLLAIVHLPSKVNWSPSDQTAQAHVLADQIRDEEKRRGNARTILVGDLNMNPFEEGLVHAKGLHAMMTKATARTRRRTVQGVDYPFFYNPMWGFFGDRTEGPPGTHYFRHSGHLSYEWNIFDQVLLRPDVLPWFRDDVEIVTRIGDTELANPSGRPDRIVGSDHFPLLFRLSPPA